MLHRNRIWSLQSIGSRELLAYKLSHLTWTSCQAFAPRTFGDTTYLCGGGCEHDSKFLFWSGFKVSWFGHAKE